MQERRQVAPRQIRAADRARKQRVANEQVCGIGLFDRQADAPGAVSGRMMHLRGKIAKSDDLPR